MSSENSFAKLPKNGRPLIEFLQDSHHLFAKDPFRLLTPLIEYLEKIHADGEFHGSISPGCIVVFSDGKIDLVLLNSRRGHPDKTDLQTYYPDNRTIDPDDSLLRDIRALGSVFYLIVAGHPPSLRDRRNLNEAPDAKSWPPKFIAAIDQMLAGTISLPSVAATLNSILAPYPELPAHPAELPPPPDFQAPHSLMPPESVRIPNAMVGRDYTYKIVPPERLGKIHAVTVELLTSLSTGLALVGTALSGCPETDGDFEINVRLHFSDIGPIDLALALTINPDPRSLWKNLPSDTSGRFWKADGESVSLQSESLNMIGASLRGRSHAHVGGFRDDDMAMAWFPGTKWHSLTVADGAGSSKYSRRGSKIACDTVKEFFTEYFSSGSDCPLSNSVMILAEGPENSASTHLLRNQLYDVFGRAAYAAFNAIDREAAGIQASIRDFHTTLITSLLLPLPNGKWFVATFSIGDGAAAIIGGASAASSLLIRPDGGEFAGQTVFLTMKESLSSAESIMARINFVTVPDFEALLLMTDGISDPYFDSDTSLAEPASWDSLWAEILPVITPSATPEESSTILLKWMDFHSPGHHDDRTMIIATRQQP